MSKYDQSFKDEAVRLALTSTQPIAKTARDLGVNLPSLYSWVNAAKDKASAISNEQGKANLVDELNRLRKENTRLKEEREILKKAAAFFAKETS